jgi:hypothetical protein
MESKKARAEDSLKPNALSISFVLLIGLLSLFSKIE